MAFEKGTSGNPGGRPKERPFRDALMLAINAADGDDKKLRRVADRLVSEAISGNVPAIKEIADRLDGKVAQAIIGGDDDDQPVRFVIVSGVPSKSEDPND